MNRRPATIVTVAVLLAMGVLSWWAAPRLPEQVPVHWNFSGEPDRYGSVAEALLTPPLIVVALSVLLWFVPNLDPRGEHIRRSARAYNALWIAVVLLMLVVHATTVLGAATSADIPVVSIVPAALGLFFIVFGVYLPKTSSNWFIGIRTPWTLTSELAWRRTHLLGGILSGASCSWCWAPCSSRWGSSPRAPPPCSPEPAPWSSPWSPWRTPTWCGGATRPGGPQTPPRPDGPVPRRRSVIPDRNQVARPARRTSPLSSTRPHSHASMPRSRRTATAARPSGTMASMPAPMLKVRHISAGATLPRSASRPKIAGGSKVAVSTTAPSPSGSARGRLPGMPPPVTWQKACTSMVAASARQCWA